MVYSGAWGKLNHEKNQKQKISWHCPFKYGHADVTINRVMWYLDLFGHNYKFSEKSKVPPSPMPWPIYHEANTVSKMEEKPLTSSLNICPEAWGIKSLGGGLITPFPADPWIFPLKTTQQPDIFSSPLFPSC